MADATTDSSLDARSAVAQLCAMVGVSRRDDAVMNAAAEV